MWGGGVAAVRMNAVFFGWLWLAVGEDHSNQGLDRCLLSRSNH